MGMRRNPSLRFNKSLLWFVLLLLVFFYIGSGVVSRQLVQVAQEAGNLPIIVTDDGIYEGGDTSFSLDRREDPTKNKESGQINNERKNVIIQDSSSNQSVASSINTQISYLNVNVDVVIYGGGLSGSAAAIELGRSGRRVLLIEPTHLLGGQASAAGVSTFDMHAYSRRYGLFKELLQSIASVYGDPNLVYKIGCLINPRTDITWGSFCPDPRGVHEGIARLMPPGVTIMYNTDVVGLITSREGSGVLVKGVEAVNRVTGQRYRVNALITIDASEYGDLIPMLGVPFYAGYIPNRGDALFNSLAEARNSDACIDSITHTVIIRNKRFAPAGFNYNFAITKPSTYTYNDSFYFLDYVVPFGQKESDGIPFIEYDSNTYPGRWSFRYETRYRATLDRSNNNPDVYNPTKTSLNRPNDWLRDNDPGGPLTVKYLADKNYRKQQECFAKEKTYKYLYYLTNVYRARKVGNSILFDINPTAIPWTLSTEEGFCDNPETCYSLTVNNCANVPDNLEMHFATIPYVRESFRIYGRKMSNVVDNGQDDLVNGLLVWQTVQKINGEPYGQPRIAKHNIISSVSVGGYGFDRHACVGKQDPNSPYYVNARNPEAWKSGYFQIPLGAFIPSKVKGFLVAEKNLAVDHFVQGGIRVHDGVVFSGQVVGIIANHLIKNSLEPRALKLPLIQEDVVKRGLKTSRFVFKDIDEEKQRKAWQYAELMNTWGIFNGVKGYFYPNRKLSRAEASIIVKRVAKALSIPWTTTQNNYFSDLSGFNYASKAINEMFVNGITSGCYYNKNTNDRRFCPGDDVNVAQLIIFLYRLGGKMPPQTLERDSEVSYCTDVVIPADTPSYFKDELRRALMSGYFSIERRGNTCKFKVLARNNTLISCDYNNSRGGCVTKSLTRIGASVIIWDYIKTTFYKKLSY